MKKTYPWTFSTRFRRHTFGWRSQPAITRIREAVTEIRRAARADPVLGAEGAVLLLEKLSPALEQVPRVVKQTTIIRRSIECNRGH